MSINLAVPETQITHLKPRISVIGVGGGGGNAVNNMIEKNLEGVDFIVANTDSQALANSKASRKIQLGLKITQGLGAGARPEVGKMAAEEAQSEIEKAIEGANMIFITAGMGGGTGSGAAPVVAKIAKEKGILTVGVVTKPFSFEGKKRMETAENALNNFTKEVDSIIIIPNQNLFRIADKNTTLADAFVMADDVLYSGVRSITDLMIMPGLINLDFADIKNIMEDKGKAIMGTGEAEGEGRARIAAEQALSNPLLDDCSMQGAKGVLINITGGNDITLLEIDEAANIIKEEVDEDANIIFGSSFDDSLNGKIRVSIVVTGIEGTKAPKIKETVLNASTYLDEKFSSAQKAENNFTLKAEDIDDNLERFKANESEQEQESELKTEAEPEVETKIENEDFQVSSDINEPEITETSETFESSFLATPAVEQETQQEKQTEVSDIDLSRFDEFDHLQASAEMPEVPQASALFSAITRTQDTPSHEQTDLQDLSDLLNEKDIFSSSTQLDIKDKEPVLFPEHNEPLFFERKQEQPVHEPEQDIQPKSRFIDKILGISRARKNRSDAPLEHNIAPTFSNSETIDFSAGNDTENLDIPSFLRRK